MLAVFGDGHRQPDSLLASSERLTRDITNGDVSAAAPVSDRRGRPRSPLQRVHVSVAASDLGRRHGLSAPTQFVKSDSYLAGAAGVGGYILAMSTVPGTAGGNTCRRDLKRQPLAVFA